MDNKPVGREYAGPSGIGRDSTWLTNEDLVDGKDVSVKIAKVLLYPKVTFLGGRERMNMLALAFVGKERVLGLNATNRKTIGKMFGNVTSAWKNQEVTLYVTETQMAGETVKCIRIRDRGSRAASAAEEFLHEEDSKSAAPVEPGAGPLQLEEADEARGKLIDTFFSIAEQVYAEKMPQLLAALKEDDSACNALFSEILQADVKDWRGVTAGDAQFVNDKLAARLAKKVAA